MKVTPEQLKRWMDKGLKISGQVTKEPKEADVKKKSKMNKTESAYAAILEIKRKAGDIIHWGFEEVTLKLASGVRYTPDFFVVRYNGMNDRPPQIEFHETKGGFIRDDARIKFQFARKQFPFFRFTMMQYKGGNWSEIYPE